MRNSLSKVSNAKVALCSTLAFLAIVTPVFAKPPENRPGKPTATSTATITPTPTVRPSSVIQSRVRLAGEKLTVCQVHEKVIQTRLQSLVRLTNTMLATFDAIAKRVEDFYTTKVLPTGKSVSNYDALLSAIQTNHDLVQSDLAITQNDGNDFVCTGIDPKGHLTQFRIDMQEVKKSLKEYRTAIKNLIVAVHTVEPGETPTPTSAQP